MADSLTTREGYFDGWARLHGGYDPRSNVLVRAWLTGAYVAAGPLARARVAPGVVTLVGVLVSAGAAALAAGSSGWWYAGAALVVVLSGLVDSLDGAVALLRGRASAWGHLLDSAADRVSDALYLVALWLAGAPGEVCAAGGALMFLHEYVRARAGAGGMTEVGVVTVWERPTRVIATAAFLASAALLGDPWPALGAWAWVGLGSVGLAQLLVVVRRRLA
ncbi:MAG: CDP-alcohol phosphatidyltransferase family protein [Actinomycetes bacterium]